MKSDNEKVVGGDITAGQPDNGNGQTAGGGYVSPYEGYKGSTYGDAISWLEGRVSAYKPESDEERRKRERREKRARWLSGVADVLGGMHRAYSYGRGVKPMELESASDKTRALIEKAKAERDGERDRVMNYAIMLGNLKAKDKEFGFNVAKADVAQKNWREQMAETRSRYAKADEQWDKEYELKKDRYAKADEQWKEQMDYKKERDKVADSQWKREFNLRSAAASSGGSSGGRGGSGEPDGYVAYDPDGTPHSFRSYQQAIDYAAEMGTRGEYVEDEGDALGQGKKTRIYPMRPGSPQWKAKFPQSGGGGGGYGDVSVKQQ